MTINQVREFYENYNSQAVNAGEVYEAATQFVADALQGSCSSDLTPMCSSVLTALGTDDYKKFLVDASDKAGIVPSD